MTVYMVEVADRVIYEVIVEADTPDEGRHKALELLTREEQRGTKREPDRVEAEPVEDWDIYEVTEARNVEA